MKLALVLHSDFSSGGGFNQSLNAARDVHRLAAGRFAVSVWTDISANMLPLKQLGMQARFFRRSWFDWLLRLLELSELGRRVVAQVGILDSLERALIRDNVDLVYFVSPSSSAARLKKISFIATVWDLCHRDWPEFPEVSSAREYFARESIYANCLHRAQLVIADSDQLADSIARRYGVDRERVLAMPFSPSPFLTDPSARPSGNVLVQYGLLQGYLFYPAQFWSHKNHVRIVQALVLLREVGERPVVAFAGSDKGNMAHLKTLVRELGLVDQVKFLGMVQAGHMHELYAQCAALIMPTYFGPTNLPPLEAWTIGKPVIYSKHLASHAADAAILVDPDSAESIAQAIRAVTSGTDSRDWVRLGQERLSQLSVHRTAATGRLMQCLEQYERRRQCWH